MIMCKYLFPILLLSLLTLSCKKEDTEPNPPTESVVNTGPTEQTHRFFAGAGATGMQQLLNGNIISGQSLTNEGNFASPDGDFTFKTDTIYQVVFLTPYPNPDTVYLGDIRFNSSYEIEMVTQNQHSTAYLTNEDWMGSFAYIKIQN